MTNHNKIKKLILMPGFIFGLILSLVFNPIILPIAIAGDPTTEEEWILYLECLGFDDPTPEEYDSLIANFQEVADENFDECGSPPSELLPWETDNHNNSPLDETDEIADNNEVIPNNETTCDEEEYDCTVEIIVENTNEAEVQNKISNEVNTGQNNIETAEGDTSLSTGDAGVITGIENIINTNATEITPDDNSIADIDELIAPVEQAQPLNDDALKLLELDEDEPDIAIELGVSNNNDANVTNNVVSNANTGSNNVESDDALVETGDANVLTDILNSVNTNSTGTSFEQEIINISETFVGNINLLEQLQQFLDQYYNVELDVINNNKASVVNSVEVDASSGNNIINSSDKANLQTGNVNVVTNIINLLNTNFIGSNWLSTTINILGNWEGNLIIPGEGVLPKKQSKYQDLLTSNTNEAIISNDVTVKTNSGNNKTKGGDESSVNTGHVSIGTSITNIINTNIVDSNLLLLIPNILGTWSGNIINNPTDQLLSQNPANVINSLTASNNNFAELNNSVSIIATSGNNQVTSDGNASLSTGDINVVTNILNVVNTNFIGSNWLFVNINLLGNWNGNIIYAYPDMTISNGNEDEAKPGDIIDYELTYSNIGYADAANVTIHDTIPDNTTFVQASDSGTEKDGIITWEIDKVGAKTNDKKITFQVQIDPDIPEDKTTLYNQVAVSTDTPESELSNNTSSSETKVVIATAIFPTDNDNELGNVENFIASPELDITKINNVADWAYAGDKVSYQINISNKGNVLINNVTVKDKLISESGDILFTKDFELGDVSAGDSVSIDYTLTISNDTAAGTYTNTAIASGLFNNEKISSADASSAVIIREAKNSFISPNDIISPNDSNDDESNNSNIVEQQITSLNISEKNSVNDFVYHGDQITFQISVSNDGNVPIHDVTVKDSLKNDSLESGSKNSQWGLGTMAPGEKIMISFEISLPPIAPVGRYTSISYAEGIDENGENIVSNDSTSGFILRNKPYSALLGSIISPAEAAEIADYPTNPIQILGAEDAKTNNLKSFLPWWLLLIALSSIVFFNYLIFQRKITKKEIRK